MPLTKVCATCDTSLSRVNRASVVFGDREASDICDVCYEAMALTEAHEDGEHDDESDADCELCYPEYPEEEIRDEALEASKEKGRKLLVEARTLGWDLKEFRETPEESRFDLALWNENTGEVIHVAWETGRWIAEPARYEYAGRVTKVKNASAAKKRMASQPDIVAPSRRRSATGEVVEGPTRVMARMVPFDPENTSEGELRSKLAGRRLVWINSVSGGLEEAHVPPARPATERRSASPAGGKQFKIENGEAGRPILTFCGPEGFRSVALEKILQVR